MQSRKAFRAILMASVLGFGSFQAQASLPTSFDVTDQWQVAPIPVKGSGTAGCVVSNQYDNGFKIRFTGETAQIWMMAIDFRQNAFQKGQNYAAEIFIDGLQAANKQARAFNGSTLLVDVRDMSGFYDVLKSGQDMTMSVQGNTFSFSLKQIQPALDRMDQCAGAVQTQEVKAKRTPLPQVALKGDVQKPQSITPPAVMKEVAAVEVKAPPMPPAMPEAELQAVEAVESKVKPAEFAEAKSKPKSKEHEIYVRRRVKPLMMPDDKMAEELASLATAAGGEEALDTAPPPSRKYPEPIDLFRKSPAQSSAPEKAVNIKSSAPVAKAPVTKTPAAKTSNDAGPVLVSRRDKGLELKDSRYDERPSVMSLFSKSKKGGQPAKAEEVVAAKTMPAAPVKPSQKPDVTMLTAKAVPVEAQQVPTPPPAKDIPSNVAQTAEPEGNFLQQSLKVAQQEIQKIMPPKKVSRASESKTPMPYKPIAMPKPYEPIKQGQVEDVASIEPAAGEIGEQALPQVDKAEPVAKMAKADEQNILTRGVKVVEPKPVAIVRQKEWVVPKELLEAQKKAKAQQVAQKAAKREMPDIKDVLDASEEAVIPISTVRSKDIFVSRPAETEEVDVAEMIAQVEPAAGAAPVADIERAAVKARTSIMQDILKTPMQAATPAPIKPQPQQWTASAGEDIKIVLARWSERAGTDLVWEADRGGKLVTDISAAGTFEQAVQTLLSQNGNALGLNGAFEGDVPSQAAAVSKPVVNAPMSLVSAGNEPITNVVSEKSLRPFLESLSRKEGFKLMWNAERDFIFKRPVSVGGTFEDMLRSALEQYDTDPVRPVGQLNINPQTGERILVIESERSL